MEYSEQDLEHARFVNEPMTPEKVLGLVHTPNEMELELAYEQRKQGLLTEVADGQSGQGGRVIPQAEFDARMSEIEQAYQTLKNQAEEEAEKDTQELDPDFPKRIQQ